MLVRIFTANAQKSRFWHPNMRFAQSCPGEYGYARNIFILSWFFLLSRERTQNQRSIKLRGKEITLKREIKATRKQGDIKLRRHEIKANFMILD